MPPFNPKFPGLVAKLIRKHGDPDRPGYRLLHPGRRKGESHRPQSRGVSREYKRARNVNLLPRPESGLGKPGQPGKWKKFMVPQAERVHRELPEGEVLQRIAGRLPGGGPQGVPLTGQTVPGAGGRGGTPRVGRETFRRRQREQAEAAASPAPGPAARQLRAAAAAQNALQEHQQKKDGDIVQARMALQDELNNVNANQRLGISRLAAAHLAIQRGDPVAEREHLDEAKQFIPGITERRDIYNSVGRRLRDKGLLGQRVSGPAFSALTGSPGPGREVGEVGQDWGGDTKFGWVSRPVTGNQRAAAQSMGGQPVPMQALQGHGGGKLDRVHLVDIDENFADKAAIDAALQMKNVDGSLIFGDGAKVILRGTPHGGDPNPMVNHFAQRVEAQGGRITWHNPNPPGAQPGESRARNNAAVLAWDDMRKQNDAKGLVVAFRPAGATVGSVSDLPEQVLGRGTDFRGLTPEVMVIQDGYRGRKNRRGEEVDSRAFGVQRADLPTNMRERLAAGPDVPGENAGDANTVALKERIKAPFDMPEKTGGRSARNHTPMSPPKGASKSGPYNRADTPAGRHITAGGDVMTAPNEGLGWFILDNPHRFELKRGGGGISFSAQYKDRVTGRYIFLKQADEGGAGNMHGDAANEVMIAGLAEKLLPDAALAARYADDPNLAKTFIVMDHAKNKFRSPGPAVTGGRNVGQPQEWLAFHLFDFLINQSDRHSGNWMEYDDPKTGKRRPIIIDNGAAGVAHYPPGGRPGKVKDSHNYDDWLDIGHLGAPRNYVGSVIKDAYRGKDREIVRDMDRFIHDAERVDIDGHVARIIQENKITDKREIGYLESMASIWKLRLQKLKDQKGSVVRFVGGR